MKGFCEDSFALGTADGAVVAVAEHRVTWLALLGCGDCPRCRIMCYRTSSVAFSAQMAILKHLSQSHLLLFELARLARPALCRVGMMSKHSVSIRSAISSTPAYANRLRRSFDQQLVSPPVPSRHKRTANDKTCTSGSAASQGKMGCDVGGMMCAGRTVCLPAAT